MSVTSSTSGPNVTMNWSVASTILVSGLTFSFDHVSWSLGSGSNTFASGAGSTTQFIGYSTSWLGTVTAVYKRSGHSDSTTTETVSGTTGAQPVTSQSAGISGSASGSSVTLSISGSCSGGTIANLILFQDGVNVFSDPGSHGSSYGTSVSLSIGYNTSHIYQAEAVFSDGSTAFSSQITLSTGSPPVPPSPPAAPPDVTDLTAVIGGSNQTVLSWSGSASGYTVYRNGSAIGSASSGSYTDTPTPTARPLSYYVKPYNSGPGGTTYGNDSNTVTFGAPGDSAGILIG